MCALAWPVSARRKEETFLNSTKVPCGVGGPGEQSTIMPNFLVWTVGLLVLPLAETGNRGGSGEENNQCSFHLNPNKKLMK